MINLQVLSDIHVNDEGHTDDYVTPLSQRDESSNAGTKTPLFYEITFLNRFKGNINSS
jgi:hypothetical protein